MVSRPLDLQLFQAAQRGDAEEVNALLFIDANPGAKNEKYGQTPLHEATRGSFFGDYIGVVKSPLDAGAPIDALDTDGQTPLHWAARAVSAYDTKKILAMRFALEAKAHLPSFNVQEQVLQYMNLYKISSKEAENIAIIKILLEAGADVHIADKHGKTPLHWAAHFGCSDKIKVFLAAGADINATDNNKSTPLHEATFHKNISAMNVLLEAGAKADTIDDNGNTPLQIAIIYGYGDNFVGIEMLKHLRRIDI
jgi:cytohesin